VLGLCTCCCAVVALLGWTHSDVYRLVAACHHAAATHPVRMVGHSSWDFTCVTWRAMLGAAVSPFARQVSQLTRGSATPSRSVSVVSILRFSCAPLVVCTCASPPSTSTSTSTSNTNVVFDVASTSVLLRGSCVFRVLMHPGQTSLSVVEKWRRSVETYDAAQCLSRVASRRYILSFSDCFAASAGGVNGPG
jgi:hypothetical protein